MGATTEKLIEAFSKRAHLPPSDSDSCLLILKTHLISEDILNIYLEALLITPNKLLGPPSNRHQIRYVDKLRLVNSLLPKSYSDDRIFTALATLNKLRNAYGHALESKNIDKLTQEFISHSRNRINGSPLAPVVMEKSRPQASELYNCCSLVVTLFIGNYGHLRRHEVVSIDTYG